MKCLTFVMAALGVFLLGGCKKDIQNDSAIEQGVKAYLSSRPDLRSMDVKVTSVTYNNNEATATVHFQAKGDNNPATGMNMQYVLERKGDGWAVKGRTGANPHGSESTGMPQGSNPAAEGSGSIGAMPNTAPPGKGPALPPGHPVIPSKPGQEK